MLVKILQNKFINILRRKDLIKNNLQVVYARETGHRSKGDTGKGEYFQDCSIGIPLGFIDLPEYRVECDWFKFLRVNMRWNSAVEK